VAEGPAEYRFFQHGSVQVQTADADSRKAAFQVSMPASVAQAVTPALMGAGVLDQYVLMNPLAAWVPSMGPDRMRPGVLVQDPEIADRVNLAVRQQVRTVLDLFRDLSLAMVDPSDLIPMLPLGVYVSFRFRCGVDSLVRALDELGRTDGVAGVAEFRFALSAALAEVLAGFGSVTGAASADGR